MTTTSFVVQWNLEIKLVGAQHQMQEALSSSQVFAVSDGSYKEGEWSHGLDHQKKGLSNAD